MAARGQDDERPVRNAAGTGKRPRFRREMIFSAAAELFHKLGYRGTRLEDIGAAVGMSGPAVYRHFASKEALLTELLERHVERAQRDFKAAMEVASAPRGVLERLVRASVEHAVEESDLVATAAREIAHLSKEARRRIGRRQRAILDGWVATIRGVRPELDDNDARITAVGVAAMVAAATRVRSLASRERVVDHITSMAMAALLADAVRDQR
jgi:AcrR family transcriptional regulator